MDGSSRGPGALMLSYNYSFISGDIKLLKFIILVELYALCGHVRCFEEATLFPR